MAYDNTITIVGNLTRDPELRFTPGGAAVANFGVAWNLKGRDGAEDKVSFFDVTCWRQLAENVSDSLTKGSRVVVHGRLDQRSWENQDGERRSKVEIVADDVAPSLKWATVELTRNEYKGDGGQGGGGGQYQPAQNAPSQGAASAPAPQYDMNEEPF